jgi:hypothetical protein
MATVLGLLLIGIGLVELLNNKKIARVFDSHARDLRSTTRQNVLGISLVFFAAGFALLLIP